MQKKGSHGYIAYRMAECNQLINNTAKATSAYMNIRYDYPDKRIFLPTHGTDVTERPERIRRTMIQ